MPKILVVDDHAINREFLSILLNYAGFQVIESRDGMEALNASLEHRPDLIISDIFMPVMDGLEFVRRLHEEPDVASIPVIFYTATYRLQDARQLAESCGVARVLPKPAEPQTILAAVADALGTAVRIEREMRSPTTQPHNISSVVPNCQRDLADLRQRLQEALRVGLDLVGLEGTISQVSSRLESTLGTVQSLSLRLTALLELGLVLASEREPTRLLEVFCRAAQDILQARYVAVGILASDGKKLQAWCQQGLPPAVNLQIETFDPRAGIFGRVINDAQAIRINNFGTEPEYLVLPALHPRIESLLLAPLLTTSGVAGWIYFADKLSEAGFQEEDEQFALTLSNQLGMAYGSLSLHDDVQRHAGLLRREVTERVRSCNDLRDSELRFRQLAESVNEVFFLIDPHTARTLYVSPRYEAIWGRSCESLYADPRSWFDAILPQDRDLVVHESSNLLATGTFNNQYRILRGDGEVRWIHARGMPIRGSDGSVQRIAGIAEDITERKEQESRIARLSRIRAVQGAISSAMLRLHTPDDILREACRVANTEGLFPMAWAGLIDETGIEGRVVAWAGEHADYCKNVHLPGRAVDSVDTSPFIRAIKSGRSAICNDVRNDGSLGNQREVLSALGIRSVAAFPLTAAEQVAGVIVLHSNDVDFFDLEEVELLTWVAADLSFALDHCEKAAQLSYLAFYDVLTTLPNARLFEDRLDQLISGGVPENGELAVVLLDLEKFTLINDAYGRQTGDQLLKQFAKRLIEYLPEPRSIGRIGADTFAIAAISERKDAATSLCQIIASSLAKTFVVGITNVRLQAQMGIALHPIDGEQTAVLFKNAETALSQAKRSGERQSYYSSEINARIAVRQVWEDRLRTALTAGHFVLHYQPRVDLTNGEVVGAEALIRLQDPVDGLIGPLHFIALAEETGLIVPIGEWVLRTVCEQQVAWQRSHVDVVPIAVNLSAVQLRKSDFLATVDSILLDTRIDTRFVEIELTESAMMCDLEESARTLCELRQRGIGLALDDFGTGFSSLAHLKRFPFQSVKIDRAFVSGITHSAEDAAIAKAIIAMAHSMDLKVIAEGIETEGQLHYLRAQGCDGMQGNFFSPPVPAGVFESFLRSGRRLPRAETPANERTVLVVDDEQGMRAALNRALRRDGYRMLTASSGPQALDILSTNAVQVIISDQRMPGMSGTDFLSIVKQLYPDSLRIILSGYADFETVTEAVNRGAVYKFLTKPWDDEQLREQIRDAFRRFVPAISSSQSS
ncbi:MAG: EAL domain-containing protein [Tahibacter sp.]